MTSSNEIWGVGDEPHSIKNDGDVINSTYEADFISKESSYRRFTATL